MPLGGDVAQLVHRMEYGEIDILNVYYFEAVDGSATLTALASWFATNVVPDVKSCQTDDVAHLSLDLVNIFDKGETHELALSGTGAGFASDTLPHFTCGSIRLLHSTGGVRSGYKRIGPAFEENQVDSVWQSGYITNLSNVGVHLVNPLSPALATWAHIVCNRIKVVDGVTGAVTYRLPENQTELNPGYPTSYSVSPNVTTQNSRKAWVGS